MSDAQKQIDDLNEYIFFLTEQLKKCDSYNELDEVQRMIWTLQGKKKEIVRTNEPLFSFPNLHDLKKKITKKNEKFNVYTGTLQMLDDSDKSLYEQFLTNAFIGVWIQLSKPISINKIITDFHFDGKIYFKDINDNISFITLVRNSKKVYSFKEPMMVTNYYIDILFKIPSKKE